MAGISAKQLDPKKPRYLVIFKEASERNVNSLSRVLNRGESKTPSRAGISVLAAGESGVETQVFHRLGVACSDLSESQIHDLQQQDDVIIVENQVRRLPLFQRSTSTRRGESGPESRLGVMSYLQGLRDAADLAIAYHEGQDADWVLPRFSPPRPSNISALNSGITWGLEAIGISASPPALTGRGVKVAVLDTGIDLQHPDFRDRVVEGESAVCFVDGIEVHDVNGHGTHCAGIVAGPIQSSREVRYGVAPETNLLIGKVFNNEPNPGASDDDIMKGIDWAVDMGARVINMSLGSPREPGEDYAEIYERVAEVLFNKSSKSVLLVAAAGNGSRRPHHLAAVENPAACPSIMAVGAVNNFHDIARFSCRQMDNIGEVDVCAPGVDIYSSFSGGGFERLQGTSMAAPHVTGMAALYLQRDTNLTARQLLTQLTQRSRQLGDTADFGAGLIRL